MFKFKPLVFALLAINSLVVTSAFAASTLQSMSDEQLSDTTGQALMNLSYIAPTDTNNLMSKYSSDKNIGFYKLGLEATMDLNANIKNLQLGCGGVNGAGACDIDIKNLSLSGLPTSSDVNGNPIYADGRPATSAQLTNPFMEFAVKNPGQASTREIVGLRFSAEKISGLLSAGLTNASTPSSSDGIQTLSGFMRIAQTTGEVDTMGGSFGKTVDQSIGGNISLKLLGGLLGTYNQWIQSYPNKENAGLGPSGGDVTTGITIPELKGIGFTLPAFQVNGNRLTAAIAQNIMLTLPSISLAKPTNCNSAVTNCSQWDNDLLMVNIRSQSDHTKQDCVLGLVCDAKFKMGAGSTLSNLNLNVTFNQALSMFHNIPLNGTGGYLSLQQMALLWPGNYVDSSDTSGKTLAQMSQTDVAQKGWWMSFADPVQLGYLKGGDKVDITPVLPQVAALITKQLGDNPIDLGTGDGLNAIFNAPITKVMNIDIGPYTAANPARLTLQNLKLANQEVAANCYGSLKFC
ncbi:hypothetical protein [Acinetobacter sp. ANC 3832]|uniref:hypothetical protein n=1 Tax=Acinetobacter sp. ANC 3832 TaxID=1977874 RepID=UPI000A346453|nr:hypothetical protein [Acinetobacter sp. ANC 3832]OTG93107.1 hypothetical protein B9T35_11285 [Acinetobacter sp. ANC 3832]